MVPRNPQRTHARTHARTLTPTPSLPRSDTIVERGRERERDRESTPDHALFFRSLALSLTRSLSVSLSLSLALRLCLWLPQSEFRVVVENSKLKFGGAVWILRSVHCLIMAPSFVNPLKTNTQNRTTNKIIIHIILNSIWFANSIELGAVHVDSTGPTCLNF